MSADWDNWARREQRKCCPNCSLYDHKPWLWTTVTMRLWSMIYIEQWIELCRYHVFQTTRWSIRNALRGGYFKLKAVNKFTFLCTAVGLVRTCAWRFDSQLALILIVKMTSIGIKCNHPSCACSFQYFSLYFCGDGWLARVYSPTSDKERSRTSVRSCSWIDELVPPGLRTSVRIESRYF